MAIMVGPYRFSVNDARATLLHIDELLDLHPAGTEANLQPLRDELHALASGVNVKTNEGDDDLATAVAGVFPRLLDGSRRALVDSGAQPDRAQGTVAQLNVSSGGVPKSPVETVEVDHGGITTDRQGNRKHHGRPWQALCLWSSEIIDEGCAEQMRQIRHFNFV